MPTETPDDCRVGSASIRTDRAADGRLPRGHRARTRANGRGRPARVPASASVIWGPSKCPTEVSFFGTECGAFAYSRGVWAIVARDSITQAIETALADCRKRGNACRIIAAACADRAERTTAIK
jgi:Domain of unknown function (DUF4189)